MTVSGSAGSFSGGVPLIWGNVPQRNKNFTGRLDLLDGLRRRAEGNVTGVLPGGELLPRALQGQSGVGKTALAVEYAHRYRGSYELVWWIPSDQLALVRSSLAGLAGRLGLEAATATGIEGAAAAVLDALRRGDPYSRWLLIFDNADQPEDLNDIIPRGPGDVLITSRNHRWAAVIDTIHVDVFTRQESKEFLTRRVPKGLSESDADLLAEKLGDLPLALEQAGALQAETGMPVDEYLRLLDEQTMQIMAEGKSPEYPLSMTAAWKLSVSTLQQTLPPALELLRCCAFFGPDPIPRDVFRRSTQAGGSIVGEVIADPILLASAIRELGRLALIKIDGRTISVHRLIQALLRDDLSPKQQAQYRHEVHSILAASVPPVSDDSRFWPRYSELVAHAVAPVTDLGNCTEDAHRAFALGVLRYLYNSGDLASCQFFAEQFIEKWAAESGDNHPTVLDARRHLCNALMGLGMYAKAYELNEATLSRTLEVLGERNPLTILLRNSLGGNLRALGDFAEARDLDRTSLDLAREVFGEVHPQTLRVMNNLALDYGLNSDYPAARETHQRAYLLQSEAGATDVPPTDVLGSWIGLARAVRLCGDFTEARDVCEDARDYGRERLGPEHYLTLRATIDLAIAQRRILTARDEALELAREVYELSMRFSGEKRPETMAAAINLINILRVTGQIDEALELAERVVPIYAEVYSPSHPYTYGCQGNLAVLRRLSGDALGARQLNESALAGLDATLSRDHFYSLTVAINLASDLAVLGETADAIALGRDSLVRARRLFGDQHPLPLSCAANLTIDLRAAGAGEEADQLMHETLRGYAATLGTDHPEAADAAAGTRLDPDFDPPPT
jgi:tetratricopeptide (TPR) repeat protein